MRKRLSSPHFLGHLVRWGNGYWGTPVLSGRGYPQGYGGMMGYPRPGVELVRLW